MDEVAQLASAGLALTLAAVLLLFSNLFVEARSVKQPLMTASKAPAIKTAQVTLYQARGF